MKKQKTSCDPTYKNIRILINDKPAIAVYDSGANVSLINYNFWKSLCHMFFLTLFILEYRSLGQYTQRLRSANISEIIRLHSSE
ncbi:unnamed protein product [Trichogramma brassicae]|uniref:Uncharacterized protein n=1 Tax=Trichogramma brassicae TaxID=86971 RepID=A0A6H5IQT5_9HYME|nr:unnamed protein product [Trichogramma brassicae]